MPRVCEGVLRPTSEPRHCGAVIEAYGHGILTLQQSPQAVLRIVAAGPASVPGRRASIRDHSERAAILRDCFARPISLY